MIRTTRRGWRQGHENAGCRGREYLANGESCLRCTPSLWRDGRLDHDGVHDRAGGPRMGDDEQDRRAHPEKEEEDYLGHGAPADS